MRTRTAGRIAASMATTTALATGVMHGAAAAPGEPLASRTVSFESASATVVATSTPAEEGNPFVRDYKFTGSVSSGSGCYSVWLSFGFVAGIGEPANIGTACAGQSAPVSATRANVYISIGGPVRNTFWLKVCRGSESTTCGQAVSIE